MGRIFFVIASDDTMLCDIALKNPQKVMLIGTMEEDIFVDPKDKSDLPLVFADFECEYTPESMQWHYAKENQSKLDKRTRSANIYLMHPPRCGKKLLVLDLDHTLLDIRYTKKVGKFCGLILKSILVQ